MPKFNVILNLPGFSIKKVSGYQPLLMELTYNRLPRCARCNSKAVRKKDSYIRQVHHELVGHRRTILKFKAWKLFCNDCRRLSFFTLKHPPICIVMGPLWTHQNNVLNA